MQRLFLLTGLIFCLFLASLPVQAQSDTAVSSLEELEIQFWPDYDRRAVLVLLTGRLPASGTVSLPFPEDGDFFVLARIDSNNNMIDDIGQPLIANGRATFTLPAPNLRFRLEYYAPYRAEGNTRSFSFQWLSELAVNQVIMRVQQPAAATTLSTVPAASGQVISQSDGLLYHTLPPLAAPPGQPLTLQVNYTMSADELSITRLPTPAAPVGNTAVTANTSPNWWLIAGAVLFVVGAGLVVWQLTLRANGRRVRKPAPRRAQTPKSAVARPAKGATSKQATNQPKRFCHECGQQAQLEDRFCRTCGTPLR